MRTDLILSQALQPALDWRDRPAVSFEDVCTWSYAELAAQVNRIANGLLRLGCRPGERVGLLLRNCPEYISAYLAITRIGAIAVRINWRLTPAELAYVLQDAEPMAILTHSEFRPRLPDSGGRHYVTVPTRLYDDVTGGPGELTTDTAVFDDTSDPSIEPPDSSSPCMLMYTSGTTGFPKGALWTHANTMWFAAMQCMRWGYDSSTVAMSTGPLFHVGSMEDHLLPTLTVGGHIIMSKSGGFSVRRAVSIIEHHGVTDSLIYPFMLTELVDDPDIDPAALSSLRTVTTGGSPLAPSIVEAFRGRYPRVRLEQVYGLTEGGAISTVMPADALGDHPASAGKPLPLTEVRISSIDDPTTSLDPEDVGEILVRSPSVCGRYWRNPEATHETFVDGWCRTGDLGKLSVDGYLYIVGRAKDMIISGGENIYPVEVENALSRLAGVRDVAVIGVPDAMLQESVCAVIVPEDTTLDAESVRSAARRELAGYKCPRHVVFVDELPRNAAGKLLKNQLRDSFQSLGIQ